MASAALASPALARNRVEFEPSGREIRMTGPLTFSEEGSIAVICSVSLSSTLHRLNSKTSGALAGYVTDARATECSDSTGGRDPSTAVTFLIGPTSVFHIQYGSITGTLPNITGGSVRLVVSYSVRITAFGIRNTCLFSGAAGGSMSENPASRINVSGRGVPLFRRIEGVRCPSTGDVNGVIASGLTIRIWLPETR